MNNKETIEYRKNLIDKYKLSNGCSICGYNKHPSALCFDHVTGEKHEDVKNGYSKKNTAGGMYKLYGKKYHHSILIGEIKKCRIICCNCHMEETHKKTLIRNNEEIIQLEDLIKKIK